jgi:O-antigen/teichoic acid export membrane protein
MSLSPTPIAEPTPVLEAAPVVPVDSIRRRYGASLVAQCFQFAFSAVTATIVPRALGPIIYGNYSFLLNMASSIRNFTDLGSQQTFFTFSSKHTASGGITRMYAFFLSLQMIVSFGLIGGLHLMHRTQMVWPGQHIHAIFAVTCLEWLVFLTVVFRQLGDTKGLTVKTQSIAATTTLVSALGLICLAALGQLNFASYVSLLASTSFASCMALGVYLLIQHKIVCWTGSFRAQFRTTGPKWRAFAAPLMFDGLYSTVVGAVDTYFIQRLYGSSQQAFFSIALRWSAIVMVFATSLMAIYWRELANALGQNRRDRAAAIYLRCNRLMPFLAMILGWWLCFNASFIIPAVAGHDYSAAIPVLMVMAFYPLAQTTGQLSGTALLASGRTALIRNLGFFLSFPHLAFTYFVLAPKNAAVPGLHLGALGVALKLVGFTLVSVQLYDWLNFKYFQLNWKHELSRKIINFAWLGLLGFGLFRFLPMNVPFLSAGRSLISIIAASGLYIASVSAIILWRPDLAGMMPSDLAPVRDLLRRFKGEPS